VSLKDLATNDKDLIDLGYQEGKSIGEILKILLNMVIDRPDLNKKKILLEFFIRNDKMLDNQENSIYFIKQVCTYCIKVAP